MMILQKKIRMVKLFNKIIILDYDVYADAFDDGNKGKDGLIDPS